jgi:hypothetical protein
MAVVKRKSTATKQVKGADTASSRDPSPQELAKRESIFQVYCNLGPARSYAKLMIAIVDTYGTIGARTLNAWSKRHSWKERLAVFDDAHHTAIVPLVVPLNFDREEALLEAASQALMRALSASVQASNPHQLKALIDAAGNAIRLVEKLREGRDSKAGELGKQVTMGQLLAKIEQRIKDGFAAGRGENAKVIEGEVVNERLCDEPAKDETTGKAEDQDDGEAPTGSGDGTAPERGEAGEIPHGQPAARQPSSSESEGADRKAHRRDEQRDQPDDRRLPSAGNEPAAERSGVSDMAEPGGPGRPMTMAERLAARLAARRAKQGIGP